MIFDDDREGTHDAGADSDDFFVFHRYHDIIIKMTVNTTWNTFLSHRYHVIIVKMRLVTRAAPISPGHGELIPTYAGRGLIESSFAYSR